MTTGATIATPDPDQIVWDVRGLVTTVVQNDVSGVVLMVAWMSRAALEATIATGEVHFWSRSRDELWRKGETSGNVLDAVSIEADCDGDALLVKAVPRGPVCHTGTETCFGDRNSAGFADLDVLWERVVDRIDSGDPESYTVRLADSGPEGVGRKVVEEATEVLLAAKDHQQGTADDHRLAEESADLIYHLFVTLAERGVNPGLVLEILRKRRAT
ncbi:MAG: bifunctional phosphoribosyl-AMP cyclohydrolase/phosphoribosyl-ATP diphosphatase HisIE [Acidimicrobiia bacterium]|nr:bifunctional phosphoribosyl-AMP cyclohydrolase/phosphoribosyl-ATP diphosphatase HisIE [Acidimicrobiia bacterium]